jgi:uncharacterized protein (TIGR02246 family)
LKLPLNFSGEQNVQKKKKTGLVVALVGLAISFALPAVAQQTNTPDPQLREQLVALTKKFDEAWNNNDAAALAALYTQDAVEVTDHGPIYGREAIVKHWADVFKQVHFGNHLLNIDQNSPHVIGTDGKTVWENGEMSLSYQVKGGNPVEIKGYHSSIAVLEDGVWKKRLITWNITPTPPAEAQTK